MKPSETRSRLASRRSIVLASIILGFCFGSLQSGASPVDDENSTACDSQGTRLKVGTQFAAGRLPRAVAAGDFNNDGLPDLVVANLTPGATSQLSILLGNGRGEFANVSNIGLRFSGSTSSNITNALAVGDLNGDSRQDVVFAAGYEGVILLLSKGDGAFDAPVNLVPESRPNAVIIADFNGDGKRDIAASADDGVVSILGGNGDGTFRQPTPINAGSFTRAMGSADLNGDGKPDLVVFAGSSSASYLNDGSGGFTKTPIADAGGTNVPFALGDFNNDGKQDLIYSDSSATRLRLGDGAGGFGQASNVDPITSFSYVAADLNKDDRPDLIAINSGVSVLLGGATAFSARTDYAAGRATVSAAVADFNQDGLLDVAAVNQGGSSSTFTEIPGGVFLLLGEAGGRLQAPNPVVFRDPLTSIKVADFNNDGRSDLAITASFNSGANVVLNSPNGFAAPQSYSLPSGNSRSTAWADFNRDGVLDLAILGSNSFSSSPGGVTVYPGTSPGVFNRDRGVTTSIGNNPDSLVAADFNRDGFVDLAAANLGSNDVSILFNNGRNGFGMETKVSTGLEPRSIVTADFDADGNPDLAVANRNGATVSMMLGDGRGGFNHRLITIGANPRVLVVADINGDSKPDLVIPNNNTAAASVVLNLGSGNFNPPVNSSLSWIPFDAAVADFTGDGKLDLAISGFSTSNIPNERVSVLAGDGSGKFTPAAEYQFPTADLMAAGDFNADGLSDLAVVGGSTIWIVTNACHSASGNALANVSAASYRGLLFSPEMIVSAFGGGFTAAPVSAGSRPLPTELGGVSVKVKDNLGVERPAPLFFAGPGQINYLMPAGVGGGSALVTVSHADQKTSSELVLLAPTSPSLFSANADGQGVPVATLLRIKFPSGEESFEPVVQFDSAQGKFVPLPIDFGPGLEPAADQLFLILFGTGIRFRTSLSDVAAAVGNQTAVVSYAGPQGELFGLDQVNLRLPRGLRGTGEVNVTVIVDGKPANPVRVAFR